MDHPSSEKDSISRPDLRKILLPIVIWVLLAILALGIAASASRPGGIVQLPSSILATATFITLSLLFVVGVRQWQRLRDHVFGGIEETSIYIGDDEDAPTGWTFTVSASAVSVVTLLAGLSMGPGTISALALPWVLLRDAMPNFVAWWSIAAALNATEILLLGWWLQKSYRRELLSFMAQTADVDVSDISRKSRDDTTPDASAYRELSSHVKSNSLSEEARDLLARGQRRKRRLVLREVLQIVLPLCGLFIANSVQPLTSNYSLFLIVAVTAATMLAVRLVGPWLVNRLGWFGSRLRLGWYVVVASPALTLSSIIAISYLRDDISRPLLFWHRLNSWPVSVATRSFQYLHVIAQFLLPLAIPLSGDLREWSMWVAVAWVSMAVIWVLLRLVGRYNADDDRRSCTLLYLRVFGGERQNRFMYRFVLPMWRGIGTAASVAGPDVTDRQPSASRALNTLFGNVRHQFIAHSTDVWLETLAAMSQRTLDYGITELHCFANTWKNVVISMLKQGTVVLMDLRGLSAKNIGCSYEIGVLHDYVPLCTVVFLVDNTTDTRVLSDNFEQAWNERSQHSPNNGGIGGMATLINVERQDRTAARRIVEEVCEARVDGTRYMRERSKELLEHVRKNIRYVAMTTLTKLEQLGQEEFVAEFGMNTTMLIKDFGDSNTLFTYGVIDQDNLDEIDSLSDSVDELKAEWANNGNVTETEEWAATRAEAQKCLTHLPEPYLS